MERDNPNISTEHQPKGSARNPSDTLDRDADSIDYVNGGDRGRAAEEERIGEKPDSMTADIDEKGRPRPPKGGPR
jgi:hypothetical protein